jgi:hypothetical protein
MSGHRGSARQYDFLALQTMRDRRYDGAEHEQL